jgi:hypothetical protein
MVERITETVCTLAICAMLAGCNKEPCQYTVYKLPYPYDIPSKMCKGYDVITPATLKSSSGLTETMGISGITREEPVTSDQNCGPRGEQINLYYKSSLYSNNFFIRLQQDKDTSWFYLQDPSSDFFIKLTDTSSGDFYWKREKTGYPVKIEVLTTFSVAGISYSPVYKITNTMAQAKGKPEDYVSYYFHMAKGLIRFEQKNGAFWEMEF